MYDTFYQAPGKGGIRTAFNESILPVLSIPGTLVAATKPSIAPAALAGVYVVPNNANVIAGVQVGPTNKDFMVIEDPTDGYLKIIPMIYDYGANASFLVKGSGFFVGYEDANIRYHSKSAMVSIKDAPLADRVLAIPAGNVTNVEVVTVKVNDGDICDTTITKVTTGNVTETINVADFIHLTLSGPMDIKGFYLQNHGAEGKTIMCGGIAPATELYLPMIV